MNPRGLRRALNQSATRYRPGGVDDTGQPTGETSATIRGRAAKRTRRTVSAETGEEVVSEAQFVTLEEVRTGDSIALPGESTKRKVVSIEEADDFGRTPLTLYRVNL